MNVVGNEKKTFFSSNRLFNITIIRKNLRFMLTDVNSLPVDCVFFLLSPIIFFIFVFVFSFHYFVLISNAFAFRFRLVGYF